MQGFTVLGVKTICLSDGLFSQHNRNIGFSFLDNFAFDCQTLWQIRSATWLLVLTFQQKGQTTQMTLKTLISCFVK